jgi:hypothetical protein
MMFVLTKVERVQRRFIRYALRGLGWMDMHDLPPYEDRCALLHLDTLTKRRSIACVMFIFDVLSGRVNSPNLLFVLYLITPRYPTRGTDIDFHRTNYGVNEPMSSTMRQFNEVISLFDFGLTRDQFLNCLSIMYRHAAVHYPFQRSICSVDASIRRINSFS